MNNQYNTENENSEITKSENSKIHASDLKKSKKNNVTKCMDDPNTAKFIKSALIACVSLIVVMAAVLLSGSPLSAEVIGVGVGLFAIILVLAALKMTGRKRVFLGLSVVGICMSVFGIALSSIPEAVKATGHDFSMMTMCGFIMFVICFAGYRKPVDREIQDERSLKIGTWGLAYSWYLTIVMIIILFWMSYFKVAVLSTETVLGVLMIAMIVSALIFQRYFAAKDDVY